LGLLHGLHRARPKTLNGKPRNLRLECGAFMTDTYFSTATGRSFHFDEETELWACRMCIGEGGMKCSQEKATAMLWALAHRFILWPRPVWKTYLQLMRAFSQPINPRWAKGGDLAKRYAGTKFATPARLRRRKHVSSIGIYDIPNHIMETVYIFAEGGSELPPKVKLLGKPKISNWASLPSTPKRFPWGIDIDGDWFFESKCLSNAEVRQDRRNCNYLAAELATR
jgi:hypothetical protein